MTVTTSTPSGAAARKLVALAGAGLASVALAACGGDDSKDSGSKKPAAPAVTKATFIAQADKACAATRKKQAGLRKQAQGKQVTQLVPILKKQSAYAKGLAAELERLKAPPQDAKRVKDFIHSVRQIGVYSLALSGSIAANHPGPAKNLSRKLINWRTTEQKLGRAYGFKVCARGNSY
jgi:hypothetical protein